MEHLGHPVMARHSGLLLWNAERRSEQHGDSLRESRRTILSTVSEVDSLTSHLLPGGHREDPEARAGVFFCSGTGHGDERRRWMEESRGKLC